MNEAHYTRIASLYDEFVKTDYDLPFFIEQAKQVDGDVLELMAGTGRLTIPLLETGIRVTALDFSADMLAILREKLQQRGLHADVHQRDVRDFQLGKRFKQIIIPFQAFPEITDEADQRRALDCIHDHLTDDGLFICTLHNPAVRLKYVDDRLQLVSRTPLTDGGTLLVWLLQRHIPSRQAVEVHEFFEDYAPGGLMRSKRYSSLQFHLLSKATFERMTAETGFEVVDLYGDYAKAPFTPETSPFMIWVLKRASSGT